MAELDISLAVFRDTENIIAPNMQKTNIMERSREREKKGRKEGGREKVFEVNTFLVREKNKLKRERDRDRVRDRETDRDRDRER